ncbi:MAG: DUF4011 domain-containing protein [Kofleriaceae bacterium]|nr:DUF4011 domain-containing protein [Kofleriaceae bacterium]
MSTAPSDDPAADRAASRLDRWRRSLLDLTLRNRLLDARDGRQSLALAGVDAVALAGVLDGGAELALDAYAAPDAARVGGAERATEATVHAAAEALAARRLLVPTSDVELDRSLLAMARSARESLEEGGARSLWIALGLLRWREDGDVDGAAPRLRHAPLALWPVELRRGSAGERYRLRPADDEPRLNDTLIEKLRIDLGAVVAPPRADDGELDLDAVMAAFAAAVAGRPGWEVVPAARLGVFAFAKFGMWTDLAERAATLLEAPLVRHLACSTGEAFVDDGPALAELADPTTLDDAMPPVEVFAPLDADATQLAAVRAAEHGKTFVLQGPPGTGKSQTISNLIAQCLARGQTVLFVSEKMAALEVVHRRLTGAGLGDFCLELHSHKARKREVIEDLGRVLERAWRPGGLSGDGGRLAAARAATDGHVRAMHAPSPLGLTVFDALARLVALRDAPRLALGPVTDIGDAAWLATRRDALARYAAAATEIGGGGDAGAAAGAPAGAPAGAAAAAPRPARRCPRPARTRGRTRRSRSGSSPAATRSPPRSPSWPARSPPSTTRWPRPPRRCRAAPDLSRRRRRAGRPRRGRGAVAVPGRRAGRGGVDGRRRRRRRRRQDRAGEGARRRRRRRARRRRRPGGDRRARHRARAAGGARDPRTWLVMARRRRELRAELDAAGATSYSIRRRWATASSPSWRRGSGAGAGGSGCGGGWRCAAARAWLRRFCDGRLPGDAATATDLDAALVVRRCACLLEEARPAARRWMGAMAPADGGGDEGADLDAVDGALDWAGELRAAFDRIAGRPRPATPATRRGGRWWRRWRTRRQAAPRRRGPTSGRRRPAAALR